MADQIEFHLHFIHVANWLSIDQFSRKNSFTLAIDGFNLKLISKTPNISFTIFNWKWCRCFACSNGRQFFRFALWYVYWIMTARRRMSVCVNKCLFCPNAELSKSSTLWSRESNSLLRIKNTTNSLVKINYVKKCIVKLFRFNDSNLDSVHLQLGPYSSSASEKWLRMTDVHNTLTRVSIQIQQISKFICPCHLTFRLQWIVSHSW